VVYIEITAKGLALLKQLDAPVDELHKSLVGHLTRAELKELSRLSEKVRHAEREAG
jgi:DNA-binding MarR family transcriptional regulator